MCAAHMQSSYAHIQHLLGMYAAPWYLATCAEQMQDECEENYVACVPHTCDMYADCILASFPGRFFSN